MYISFRNKKKFSLRLLSTGRALAIALSVLSLLISSVMTGLIMALKKVHLVKATEKAMAPHSSTLAWKIPWTEPGGLQSMGLHRVRHDWSDLAAAAVKAMVFPVVLYGCKSWAIKKAECWRIDVFELWCWRRLFESLLESKEPNQSVLKEINPEYSWAGLTLKLKLQ